MLSCRRVRAHFNPEILQVVAVMGLNFGETLEKNTIFFFLIHLHSSEYIYIIYICSLTLKVSLFYEYCDKHCLEIFYSKMPIRSVLC